MTNTTNDSDSQLFKTDVLGGVLTPADRRESLLDEFERSGLSLARPKAEAWSQTYAYDVVNRLEHGHFSSGRVRL